MVTQHIPAWKRLGLKLKYANETSPTTDLSLESSGSGSGKKRPLDNGHSSDHQLKKSRIEHGTPQDQLKSGKQPADSSTPKAADAKRKKSVTFTSDTKVEDGETAQTIQFWVPGSPGSTPKRPTNDSGTAESEESPGPPVKRKKVKKPKDQKVSSSPLKVAGKGAAALEYLNQFHHQKSSWKFNKNHEVWLLKHALSTDHIPIEYNLALASYMNGLKSAGAKQRLVEQSRDAVKSIDMSAQEEANTRAKTLQAVNSSHDQNNVDDEQKQSWFESQDRGQLLLFSLDENLKQAGKSMQLNGQVLPRVKKNKSRTSRVEVESSSSSESESESESEGESDEDGIDTVSHSQQGLTSTISNGPLAKPSDDTSSEGISDSSSERSSEDGDSSSASSDSE